MIPEEITQETTLSATLDHTTHHKTEREVSIEPWHMEATLRVTHLSIKNTKLRTLHSRNAQTKRWTEIGIGRLYRRQSKEGTTSNAQNNNENSRELYRAKLRQIENGPEFRRMGSERDSPQESVWHKNQPDLSIRRANLYCCDYSSFEPNTCVGRRLKSEYKCSDKFQRMLKLKDRIRKKNHLAVTKQKQKFQSQYQSEVCSEAIANAIERDGVKPRTRALQQDFRRRRLQLDVGGKKQDHFAIQSRSVQFKATKKGLQLVYDRRRCAREDFWGKLNHTLPCFTR